MFPSVNESLDASVSITLEYLENGEWVHHFSAHGSHAGLEIQGDTEWFAEALGLNDDEAEVEL